MAITSFSRATQANTDYQIFTSTQAFQSYQGFEAGSAYWDEEQDRGYLCRSTVDGKFAGSTFSQLATGVEVITGASGGFAYSATTTATDPGAGNIQFNNADPTLTTEIYISATDSGANDFSTAIASLTAFSYIQHTEDATSANSVLFQVSGTPVDNTGWYTIPVIHNAGATFPAVAAAATIQLAISSAGGDSIDIGLPTQDFDASEIVAGSIAPTAGVVYNVAPANSEVALYNGKRHQIGQLTILEFTVNTRTDVEFTLSLSSNLVKGVLVGGCATTDQVSAQDIGFRIIGDREIRFNRTDSVTGELIHKVILFANGDTMASYLSIANGVTAATLNGTDLELTLASGQILTADLSSLGGGGGALTADSVGSSEIIDGAVATADIAANAVAAAKLAADAVTTAKIADDAVTSAKIADDAVITAKINDAAVTTAKIADEAVTQAEIKPGAAITEAIAGSTYPANTFVTFNGAIYKSNVSTTGDIAGADAANWDLFSIPLSSSQFDSSAATDAKTLPAATGSGAALLYMNVDVASNPATLAPVSGEAINGTTDLVFQASNFPSGTSFIAVDVGVGQWTVTPLGERTTDVFQTKVETLTYAASAVESLSFTHDRTQATSGTNNIFVEDLTIVRNYIGNGQAHVEIYGYISFLFLDPEITITLPTGTLTTPYLPDNRALRPELNVSAYVVMDVSADTIVINRDDNIDGTSSPVFFKVEGLGNWVGEEPAATVSVGEVVPTDLHRVSLEITDRGLAAVVDDLIQFQKVHKDANNLFDGTSTITIAQDGEYSVDGGFTIFSDSATNNQRGVLLLKNYNPADNTSLALSSNLTDGTTRSNTSVLSIAETYSEATEYESVSFHWSGDLVAGDTITCLFVAANNNDRVRTGTLRVAQQPASTVVNPETLTPTTLARVKYSLATSTPLALLDNDLLMDSVDRDVTGIAASGVVTITSAGDYLLIARGGNATPSNNSQVYIKVNGSKLARAINSKTANGQLDNQTVVTSEFLNVGDVIQLGLYSGVVDNTPTAIEDRPTLEVVQQSEKSVIVYDPGEVEVDELGRNFTLQTGVNTVAAGGKIPFADSQNTDGSSVTFNGTDTWTLQAGKKYRAIAAVVLTGTVTNGNVRWRNNTTNTLIGATGVMTPTGSNLSFSGQPFIVAEITPTVDTEISVENISGLTFNFDTGFAIVEQLPTLEVLTPDSIPAVTTTRVSTRISAGAVQTLSKGVVNALQYDSQSGTAGVADLPGNRLVVPKDSTYEIALQARNETPGSNHGFIAQIEVNGAAVAAESKNSTITQVDTSYNIKSGELVLSAGDVVTAAIEYQGGVTATAKDTTGGAALNWLELVEKPPTVLTV